ncbi:MAG: glycogen/starch synthase [Desulfobacterales bacterium]
MVKDPENPRILIVTPEVTYLPDRMKSYSSYLTAKAGGLADVSASLISALFTQGADVHVALPDYRSIFRNRLAPFLEKEQNIIRRIMPDDRLHLAQDRAFFYLNRVYSDYSPENITMALAFQREIINNIIPRVNPDLIHCNDWMTGLIPAVARQMGIPCLFTIHNIHSVKRTLADIEDRGIDAAAFWQYLYYDKIPDDYNSSRENDPVDFLLSGIFAAHFVNTVSPTFLKEIVDGKHDFISEALKRELSNKWYADCAFGILNAPDSSFNPRTDPHLAAPYDAYNHFEGKKKNKFVLQKLLALIPDQNAPLLLWPSRLDPVQKGCQLLADIFYGVISTHWDQNLQIVFVADGDYQPVFRNIVDYHHFSERVAICNFDQHLEHLAYGASDFILMPSRFEPCGLPQMIGAIYGSLPVAFDTGGIHDTVVQLDPKEGTGNGFLFANHDANGLWWAIQEALSFYNLPQAVKASEICRIMIESERVFNHSNTARQYIALYEKMLKRPLLSP